MPHFEDGRSRYPSGTQRSRPKVIGLSVVGGVLVLGSVLLISNLFGAFRLFGSGIPKEILAWIPEGSKKVVFVDVEKIQANSGISDDAKRSLESLNLFGLETSAVSYALFASGSQDITIVKLRSNVSRAQVNGDLNGVATIEDGKTYYVSQRAKYYFATNHIVVLAWNADAITDRLRKDEGKVVVTPSLLEFIERGRGVVWSAHTGGDSIRGQIETLIFKKDTAVFTREIEFDSAEALNEFGKQTGFLDQLSDNNKLKRIGVEFTVTRSGKTQTTKETIDFSASVFKIIFSSFLAGN